MPSFTFNWGNLFKEKVKENADTIEDVVDTTKDVVDIVKNPSTIIDSSFESLDEGFNSIISLFIVGFIYIIFISIIIFSTYQIFKKNPQPLNTLNKTYAKGKKFTKKAINKFNQSGGKKK